MPDPSRAASTPLLPCPFCGSDLYRKRGRINPTAYCVTEDCYGRHMSAVNLDDARSVAAWNARGPGPSPATGGDGLGTLPTRCAEILDWQKTGRLTDGEVRKLASAIELGLADHMHLNIAEKRTVDEALAYVAALSAPPEREAVHIPGAATSLKPGWLARDVEAAVKQVKEWETPRPVAETGELADRIDQAYFVKLNYDEDLSVKEIQMIVKALRANIHDVPSGVGNLTWSGPFEPNEECRYNHCYAETPFGRYQVEWKGWKDHPGYTLEFGREFIGVPDNLAAAKEIALEDYRLRLASALPATEPVVK